MKKIELLELEKITYEAIILFYLIGSCERFNGGFASNRLKKVLKKKIGQINLGADKIISFRYK